MIRVRRTTQTATGGWKHENKCNRWGRNFILENFPGYRPTRAIEIGGIPEVAGDGTITIEPRLAQTATGMPIVTSRYLRGFGPPAAQMTAHVYFKVIIKPFGGRGCTMYFDLGRNSPQGSYGGDDQWFSEYEGSFATDLQKDPDWFNPDPKSW